MVLGANTSESWARNCTLPELSISVMGREVNDHAVPGSLLAELLEPLQDHLARESLLVLLSVIDRAKKGLFPDRFEVGPGLRNRGDLPMLVPGHEEWNKFGLNSLGEDKMPENPERRSQP